MAKLSATGEFTRLKEQVEKTKGVVQSTTMFVKGLPTLIQAKIDLALANGATAAELAPFYTLGDELTAEADALAAAVAANP